jgi:hypothetical protein
MLIYTTSEVIKNKLLSKGEVLITNRRVKNQECYFFRLKNPSIIQSFTYEENKEIFICNNNLFL